VDLDNTIICYDELFHRVASEQGLIPPHLPPYKDAVRDYLRETGKEDLWTEMQGYVYGERIREASPFPGVMDFFETCASHGIDVRIISHKTRHPYSGPRLDLHWACLNWLGHYGFFEDVFSALEEDKIFLEPTKDGKLARIGDIGCTHFIDDLPEFLLMDSFPKGVVRMLFDRNNLHSPVAGIARYTSWYEIQAALLDEPGRIA